MCKKGRALCNKRAVANLKAAFTTSNDLIEYSFLAAWTDAYIQIVSSRINH